ncbi:MAG: hypothetical protein H6734_07845 [Alphaproteobacteria bacterium]|nr:hypothetical protein [Alphaproteobacteria bacterium]
MIAVLTTALAQQAIVLESGPTDLQPCLDEPACEGILVPLASETLVEFGWFLQNDPLQGSALVGRGTGFVFEIHADSYVLGKRNLITEQVEIPPLLPKVEVAYQLGSFTYDDPFPQLAVGLSVFPPLKIDGYQLLNATLTGSGAVPVYEHYLWLGAEVSAGYGNVKGEMLGDGSAIEEVDSIAPFVEIDEPPCARTAAGCNDNIRQTAWTARLGVAVDPIPELFLYGKVGVAHLSTRLDIAYDTSVWRVKGVQPQLSYGGGVRIGDRVMFGVGGTTAMKPEPISSDDSRTITRLHLGLSVRTGDARYWYEEEPPAPATSP